MIVYVRAGQRYTPLEELDVGNTEDDDQIFRGDPCPYIFLTFFRIIVHNGGPLGRGQRQTVEEADSVTLLMNRQATVAV
jgi:hypothetical protein